MILIMVDAIRQFPWVQGAQPYAAFEVESQE